MAVKHQLELGGNGKPEVNAVTQYNRAADVLNCHERC